MNIVLTENDEGPGVIAHAEACPVVKAHRAAGREIMTLVDISKPIPYNMPVHSCLQRVPEKET